MRGILGVMVAWLMSMAAASAQVKVEIALDQEQFMAGEAMVVGVRIANFSGQTLALGQKADWLEFNVEAGRDLIVAKFGDPPVAGEFKIEPGSAAVKWVDLTPHFNMGQPGRYFVRALVRLPQWNQELVTASRPVSIIAGTKLWQQEIGVPGEGDKDKPPEVRKYTLVQANTIKQIKLYFRLTNVEEDKVFKVFAIGPLVSFGQPERQVDRANNLHVLHQTGAKTFHYCVINPDGELFVRQTHQYTSARPTLRPDRDGNVAVFGGIRMRTPSDLPTSDLKTGVVPNAPSMPATNIVLPVAPQPQRQR